MPTTYDAIIIGAGHNGLCLAAYLARAGLKTAIIERRHEEGGGANTEDPVISDFRFNMHANYMEFFDIMPMIDDFDLQNCGLRSITPENQAGIAFSDGRPPIVLHRKDLLDKTHKSISHYSKADADTYIELQKRTMDFGPLLGIGMYSPPFEGMDEGQAAVVESMYGDMGITGKDIVKTPKVMIDELFESPEMRTLLYRVAVEFGVGIDTGGSGGLILTALPWMIGCWRLAKGGTHTLAKAMTPGLLCARCRPDREHRGREDHRRGRPSRRRGRPRQGVPGDEVHRHQRRSEADAVGPRRGGAPAGELGAPGEELPVRPHPRSRHADVLSLRRPRLLLG